ncbi:hypothetical protein VSH64_14290 [Amycolatopsis rhabdoformis]|uniref:Uncharacterized protein n=1 Tax=Amycolatopsis rhabdoformis TaxID=1448059 RepID=A0ABZ1IFM5_9PSEU|nr:hypothetical protein [Amycolatopsis rhabdoformis]WSE33270.1 hypothetical protein VSH64_14290 [Amycolatopsis rhabdoformis]
MQSAPVQSAEFTTTVVHHRMCARFELPAWLRRLRGDRDGLSLDADGLRVRLGPFVVSTPLGNLAGAEVSGPYRAFRVFGARLSLADRGLTLGTSTRRGVCIRFHEPVPGIEPFGLVRHPGLTVTVAEPELVAETINAVAAPSSGRP